ncbi:ABC transporter ATP-binding protein [Labrys neptuniae]
MGSIQFDRVSKKYGSHQIVSDVSLEVKDGEFVVFVGPSGCGKSSVLRLITGLEQLSDGRVLIDGTDVSRLARADRRIAMVFQSYALYPHMSVCDNIGFGLKIAGMPKQEIASKVAIGRAIVRSSTAFPFDKPLSNLDAALRVQMRIEPVRQHRTLRTTMIDVTHDQVEAMTMADRIVVLRAGNAEQFSTPLELYDRAANLFVASFIGSLKMNFVPAMPSGDKELELAGGSKVALPDWRGTRLDQKMTFGVRPEHVLYSPDAGLWDGTVSLEKQLGSDALLYVDVPSLGTIPVRAVGERRFKTGDRIFLTPDASRVHLFDEHDVAIAA